MAYLSDSPDETAGMLRAVGADDFSALLAQVPPAVRLDRPLDLPAGLAEPELESAVRTRAGRNAGASSRVSFLGGGAYDHFIPAVVDEVCGRGEYYTAYTPYQAEASQGSLQAFFEFQTLVCRLTGLPVSNASLYEAASGTTEAALMAMRVTGRGGRIVVLGSVHPETRQVLHTLLANLRPEIVTVPCPAGVADPGRVAGAVTVDTACVIVQHPNVFGGLEAVSEIFDAARGRGALCVQVFDPISVGLLKTPGDLGADIAVGEGQSLGVPLSYGGPYLGLFACREEFVRKMPGRLVGQTTDADGKPCFVLAMQTREQHIRRGKATSNICTNQGLLALRATVHLSLLGPHGLREVADRCLRNTRHLADRLVEVGAAERAFDGPPFRDVTLRATGGVGRLLAAARDAGFDLGPALSRFPADLFPEIDVNDLFLASATELRTRAEIEQLADAAGSSV